MPQSQSSLRSADTADPFSCQLEVDGRQVAWVSPAGELDIAGQARFSQVLGQAQRAAREVVVDLRALTFMDCSGVRVIAEASRRARASGQPLAMIRGPAQVHRLLVLTGIDPRLEVQDTDWREPRVQTLLRLVGRDALP